MIGFYFFETEKREGRAGKRCVDNFEVCLESIIKVKVTSEKLRPLSYSMHGAFGKCLNVNAFLKLEGSIDLKALAHSRHETKKIQ